MPASLRYMLLPVFWTLFTLVLSLLPPSLTPDSVFFHFPFGDKILHLLFYFILTLLWLLSVPPLRERPGRRMKIRIALGCILFGGLVEILQDFTGFRTMDLVDWLADVAGAAMALMVYNPASLVRSWLTSKIKCLSVVFPA